VGKNDPVRQLEHSHGHLSQLALGVSESLRAAEGRPSAKTWKQLAGRLEVLRDELLRHFADEEEAVFPFVRASVPEKAAAVDRLEAAHDTLCGCVVRMVHVAAGEHHRDALLALHERFEKVYSRHSREEAELFEGLAGALSDHQRKELADLLRGL